MIVLAGWCAACSDARSRGSAQSLLVLRWESRASRTLQQGTTPNCPCSAGVTCPGINCSSAEAENCAEPPCPLARLSLSCVAFMLLVDMPCLTHKLSDRPGAQRFTPSSPTWNGESPSPASVPGSKPCSCSVSSRACSEPRHGLTGRRSLCLHAQVPGRPNAAPCVERTSEPYQTERRQLNGPDRLLVQDDCLQKEKRGRDELQQAQRGVAQTPCARGEQ